MQISNSFKTKKNKIVLKDLLNSCTWIFVVPCMSRLLRVRNIQLVVYDFSRYALIAFLCEKSEPSLEFYKLCKESQSQKNEPIVSS